MIKITIKKYMWIDMLILSVIGIIVEFIGVFVLSSLAPNYNPVFVVSILIIVTMVARWGAKGIVLAPVLAVISWVAGLTASTMGDTYGWAKLVSNVVSFTAGTALLIPIRKALKGNLFKDYINVIVFSTMTVLAVVLIWSLLYSAINTVNPIAVIMYYLFQSLAGYIVTIIFMIALKKQGILVNVRQDLINKAKEREAEKKYYSQYTNDVLIKADSESKAEDNESQK